MIENIPAVTQPKPVDLTEPRQTAERRAGRTDSLASRPALGLAWHIDTSTYLGPYLGGSVVLADRFAVTARMGILFAGKDETTEPIVERSVRRVFGEYRAPTGVSGAVGVQ